MPMSNGGCGEFELMAMNPLLVEVVGCKPGHPGTAVDDGVMGVFGGLRVGRKISPCRRDGVGGITFLLRCRETSQVFAMELLKPTAVFDELFAP